MILYLILSSFVLPLGPLVKEFRFFAVIPPSAVLMAPLVLHRALNFS